MNNLERRGYVNLQQTMLLM